VFEFVTMALYSLLLASVLVLGAPYWLIRMATGGRYRAGLAQRFGRVPAALRAAVAGRQIIWVHAVSVGEVLAATRLVAELEAALGENWRIVVSTTTATGQALATQRFAAPAQDRSPQAPASQIAPQIVAPARVFYYPLDFAFAVRAYLRALRPRIVVLMESELWPRMTVECNRAHIPVAVVNARISDRSYARGLRVRAIWRRILRRVNLFLAQSDEDARRLIALGATPAAVRAAGNLKYDVRAPQASRIAEILRTVAAGRPIIVAGSTVRSGSSREEDILLPAMQAVWAARPDTLLVLAPRHPQRFDEVWPLVSQPGPAVRATDLLHAGGMLSPSTRVVLLDTVGDLAAVYSVASIAFVGGSLVVAGGHNPLEPAQFAVPVIMGPSYQNFRDIVGSMIAAGAIHIAQNGNELEAALIDLLNDPDCARALGQRGRQLFLAQQGATARTVEALLTLLPVDSGNPAPPTDPPEVRFR
jgi:3-deoxy-D-manno-octulosonic-acid transferase